MGCIRLGGGCVPMFASTLLPSENSVERVAAEAPLPADAGLPLWSCPALRSLMDVVVTGSPFTGGSLSDAPRSVTANTFTGILLPCK